MVSAILNRCTTEETHKTLSNIAFYLSHVLSG